MTEPDTTPLTSPDPIAENVAKLRELFPEAVTEDGVDLEVLGQLLGKEPGSEGDEETYGLSWNGKSRARQIAASVSTGTLRPAPEDSVEWDTTQNLVIEGDNLEVLKLLKSAYAGKVKLIYIDPPYNTGKDFVYKDDFKDNIANYLEQTGQVDEEGRRLSTNTETSGRFHTDWLNMMYPRLKLAKDLLSEDGVMFVSIDDYEMSSLRTLLDLTFGDTNRLGIQIWAKGTGSTGGHVSGQHEYLLVYAKNKSCCPLFAGDGGVIDHGALKIISSANPARDFSFPKGTRCELPNGSALSGTWGERETMELVQGDFTVKDGKLTSDVIIRAGYPQLNQMRKWFDGERPVLDSKGQEVKEFYFGSTGLLRYQKIRTHSSLPSLMTGMTQKQGTDELESLLGEKVVSYPKPRNLLSRIVGTIPPTYGGLVLDFFAGSGTTGHAVMAQNAEDGGDRRYILVQLPEPLDPEVKEQKVAAEFCDELGKPRNIAELTKERLRRAGEKVKEENPEFEGDTGFRVFKLDSTNVKAWDPDLEDLEQTLLDSVDTLKEGRSDRDVLYEVLLKLGLDLCVPIETKVINGLEVSSIGAGTLFACMADRLDEDSVEGLGQGILDWKGELEPAGDVTCLFKDGAFTGNQAKTNLVEILSQGGIKTVRCI
jgi:adenine-specific DNA-methyltransferase